MPEFERLNGHIHFCHFPSLADVVDAT